MTPKRLVRAVISRFRRWRTARRRARYTREAAARVAEAGPGLKVNGPCTLSRNTHLGANVNMNGLDVHGGGTVRIGDNFHSGTGCLLVTAIHDYDHGDAVPYGEGVILQTITIGDNVWLGTRVIVLGDVTIGDGAIIQAGSVVVGDIPRCAIAGGHPARVFAWRDIEHYDRLVSEGKFL